VLEFTYTSQALAPWARDLEFEGSLFSFSALCPAAVRAALDVCYGKLHGLTCDELRYFLHPADIMGDDYPSDTLRVLKNREQREYGEYRTRRLVLEAWDRLDYGELR